MTETQAKNSASTGTPGDGAVSGGAAGQAVVGRATVPSEPTAPPTKFTRPPGMVPPPGSVPSESANGGAKPASGVSVAAYVASSSNGTNPDTGGAKIQVAEAVRAAKATVSAAAARGPRRARLHLKRIDPWSVMKFSFSVSVVMFIVMVVATAVLYLALDAMGVFDQVNRTLASLIGSAGDSKGGISFKITALGVIGTAAVLGVVNMVLFTALSTLGSFIYNVCADLVGGVELTLSEKE